MKILLLTIIILQISYFPIFTYLCKRGFNYLDFTFFKFIGYVALFIVLAFTLPKTLPIQILLFFYFALLLDEFLRLEMVYKIYEKVMLYGFGKDTRSSFNMIPLIKIGFLEMHKMDLASDWENMLTLGWYVSHRKNPLTYDNHDVSGFCDNKKWYGFLVPGWYGEKLAKMIVLIGLLYCI